MSEGFEESLKCLCQQITKTEDKYHIVLSEENYPRFQNLLKQNGMTYVVRHSETHSGGKIGRRKRRLLWSSLKIPFFGIPFFVEKTSGLQCTNGPKYYPLKSNKTPSLSLEHSNSMNESDSKPFRSRRAKPSKKIGCNATMSIFIVKSFPEYCIKGIKCMKDEKLSTMKLLKKTLDTDSSSVVIETQYHISFSTPNVHCHSVLANFTGQQLDPALKTEIRNLVESGVTNIQTIKAFLCKWVKNNIGDVNNSSRAYWPTKKTIRNYVMKYAPQVKYRRIKEEKQASKIKINYRKKRPIEKKYSYESYTAPEAIIDSSIIEINGLSSEIPEIECTANDYQYQITCSSSEPFDSSEEVSCSEIRQIAKAVYDRSLLLPNNCADAALHDKLLDVYHLMNSYIERNENVLSS